MLVTNDKCADKWTTVKNKSKSNTNIVSPSSFSTKNPSQANLQIRFDNLIVTEVNQIEIHESQDHTPINHHKRCETLSLDQERNKIINPEFVHLLQQQQKKISIG